MTSPAYIESKVQKGAISFTIGGGPAVVFSCQPTAVAIVPDVVSTGDAIEVLCGDKIPESKRRTWTLQITAVQDFDNKAGLIRWSIENDLKEASFSWTPNETADVVSGHCEVNALQLGGPVATRNTSDAVWPILSGPDFTAQPAALAAPAKSA